MTPHRPQLGPVLDALTTGRDGAVSPSFWIDTPGVRTAVIARDRDVIMVTPALDAHYRWITTDVAEAWELLQARDLVPLDSAARFVCDRCHGAGRFVIDYDEGETMACHVCTDGHRPHPPTVAALAAWASLGWRATDDGHPGIAGAEEWAEQWEGRGARWRIGALPPVSADIDRYPAGLRIRAAGLGTERLRGWTALVVPPLGGARRGRARWARRRRRPHRARDVAPP